MFNISTTISDLSLGISSYLNDNDFDKNKELIELAEKINNNYWFLKLEQIVRKLRLGIAISPENVDENTFTNDPRIKANYFRLYGLSFEFSGYPQNADSFMERAIQLEDDELGIWTVEKSMLDKLNRYFEDSWRQWVENHKLTKNKWLISIYNIRHQ